MIPRNTYLICTTPRSGSTLLCQLLIDTTVAGNPREYFEFLKQTGAPMQGLDFFLRHEMLSVEEYDEIVSIIGESKAQKDYDRLQRWHHLGYARELHNIVEGGCTANGIFGAKMMWGYYGNFSSLIQQQSNVECEAVHSTLLNFFPNLRYIWNRRRDKTRQAISLWKAIQTQQWRQDRISSGERPTGLRLPRKPKFHFGAIRHLERMLLKHDAAWCSFFSKNRIEPLTLEYESFTQNMMGGLKNTLAFLEIPRTTWPKQFSEPNLVRQANSESDKWLERFICMASTKTVAENAMSTQLAEPRS